MAEKMIKVAILRKINNLENDDRIRKEVTSLKKIFPNVVFKCFVMLPENSEFEGVTSYGLPYKSIRLSSRDRFGSGKFLMAKMLDYYLSVRKELKKCDVVWCSGDAPTPILFFIFRKPLVWDLRELPLFMMGSSFKDILLKYLFKKCTILLHANQYRIDYLSQKGLIKNTSKHFPIRNFPDFEEIDKEYDERYNEVRKWIGDRFCIYLQGLSDYSRASVETLTAVMDTPNVCAIVLGRYDEKCKKTVESVYGEYEVTSKICFAGNFKVLKVPQYMQLCKISLVFYKNVEPNNYYCEANRLYQAISMSLPVVVGNNPPMKSLVEKYKFGVSIDTDGGDIDLIKNGIKKVIENYDEYYCNTQKYVEEIKWINQEPLLEKIFCKIFK